ncbi:hypothetical protein PR048_015527 [Dryococelus australis]|uniref:Uncharacterized protein n=1 Tax=Dryococelus australis TaxID=614101 RepID=A0ABQ9HI81_9NEOP|nr:hypothetical protein PR048_015527 [Dryococelus australis]
MVESYTVVDGGFLLQLVKWNDGTKFSSICQYVSYLINHYVETFTARGIEASTATGDTDGSIARFGLNKVTSHSSVVVTGEDVDLLVLPTALTLPDRNVYFMKPGRGNIEDKAPPSECDLNNHRYNSFVKSSTSLASLPPTQGAAKQHSFRLYLQTQKWLDNHSLNPAHWGWVRDDGGVLNPVKTTDPIAPDSVMIKMFCCCATGCGGKYGCRNAGGVLPLFRETGKGEYPWLYPSPVVRVSEWHRLRVKVGIQSSTYVVRHSLSGSKALASLKLLGLQERTQNGSMASCSSLFRNSFKFLVATFERHVTPSNMRYCWPTVTVTSYALHPSAYK